MVRNIAPVLIAVLALASLNGCDDPTTRTIDCDLDAKQLSGQWVSLKGGGEGADVPDKFARVEFKEIGEKKVAIYTAGALSKGNPATNKYTYDFIEITNLGEAKYVSDTMAEAGRSKQRIDRLKKDNRRLDLKFEGRMYVSVNRKTCTLTIKDMYATWVRGEEIEDSNPSGVRTYIQNDFKNDDRTEEFSMVHCDDPGAMFFFEKKEIDLKKDEALNSREGIYALEPVFFHYIPELPEEQGDDKEALQKALIKKGLVKEEGCTYDYEIWMRDTRVTDAQEIAVTPKEDGTISWVHEHQFKKSSAIGLFIEMHRYKTCGGKRELLSNTCNVASPNRSKAEYAEEEAKEKAAAEAKKKAAEGGAAPE